jgi:heme/copper-type cytochrome/quinol oxidase subunit 2
LGLGPSLGPTEATEGQREEAKAEGSTGLLVVSILMMLLVCVVFAFLIYKERRREEREEAAVKYEQKETEISVVPA